MLGYLSQETIVSLHCVTVNASMAPICIYWSGAIDLFAVTQCGAIDTVWETQCGAIDIFSGPSITSISAVSAYLKLKSRLNLILSNAIMVRKPSSLTYQQFLFLDRVPLIYRTGNVSPHYNTFKNRSNKTERTLKNFLSILW